MSIPKAGEIVKCKLFLYAPTWKNGLYICTFTDDDSPLLGCVDVEFIMPAHGDINSLKVEILEKELKKMNAEHIVKINNIKGQIQELLAIGHEVNSDNGVVY